ncbi:MAG TPA: hypothetical protein VFJ16_27435 [Longimicrobium sp.]|nr:hypothetical protein [Longimicrobium sp.]
MRRLLVAVVTLLTITAACTASPTAAKQKPAEPTVPAHTGATDSTVVKTAEERNGNTMGSGH